MKPIHIEHIKISIEVEPYKTILKGIAEFWEALFFEEYVDVLLMMTESLEKALQETSRIPFIPDSGKIIMNKTCCGYKYIKIPDEIGQEVFGLNSETIALIFYNDIK